MGTTKREIEKSFENLCRIADVPTSKKAAVETGRAMYCAMDYSQYGGYRLVMVNVDGGGESGAFGQSSSCPRLRGADFDRKLRDMADAMQWVQTRDK